MDETKSIVVGNLIACVIGIVGYIIKLNHKRIRSKCCNRDCTTSVDVEDTTPQNNLKITIPPT